MDLTVQELAALVGGQFVSGESAPGLIRRAAAIAEAEEGDVTFLSNPRYLAGLKDCHATVALVPADFAESIKPVAMRVADPGRAFAIVLERLAPTPISFPEGVHLRADVAKSATIGDGVSVGPCAVIETGAQIGANTVIGAGSYIGHDARVGRDCQVGARVTIGARCVLGDRVNIHSGAVIGSDGFGFELKEGRHVKIPQTGIVQVDDDVEIGANTTIDRARFGRTWIGAGTKIDNLVQIAHNVVIGQHCIICAQVGISGSVRLGNYVVLGGQVGVIGHIELADGVQAGAQSGISKSHPAGTILWGSPAGPVRETKEQMARVARLDKLAARVRRLEQAAGGEKSSSHSP